MSAIDDLLKLIEAAPEAEMAKLAAEVVKSTRNMVWVPTPGPQTLALESEADELLFGGEAGGGKSDLLIGLSLTQHERSLVLRRTNVEANKLVERYTDILGGRDGWNSQEDVWRLPGRVIDIGGCQLENDKQKRKGIPHDFIGFDELVDFTLTQYLFITAWNRSTTPGQRCRIVATSNPPTTPEGMWVVERWGAWLDPKHHNPALPGELRWYTAGPEGGEIEVDGPGPHLINEREVYAKSRTFIRSKLSDNPDLSRTPDYAARLAALPPELRAAYLEGKFDAGLKDQAFQAIPTEWVRAAMRRWKPNPRAGVPMCGMGVDASGGGADPMVIASRFDGWYAPMEVVPGKDIPASRAGRFAGGLVLSFRRNQCPVVVDMGGGYGGGIYEHLKDNGVEAIAWKGAEGSVRRTKDGQLKFKNKRTQAYWQFREALDPEQANGSPIDLPDDPMLLADLCAPTFEHRGGEIVLESKEEILKRMGRSPDKGDAVVMCWQAGPTYVTDGEEWAKRYQEQTAFRSGRTPQVVMGRENRRK